MLFHIEKGRSVFLATSTTSLLKNMGVRGYQSSKTLWIILSNAAEKSSNWLWIKGKGNNSAASWRQEGIDLRRVYLGCQVSPLSPLEKLWAFQCNVNKRGSQPDDPDDEPTFTSPVALPTCQCTTEIKLNPFSFNFPHNLSGPSQVESLNLRITHELDSLRGIGKLHRDKLVIRQHVAT